MVVLNGLAFCAFGIAGLSLLGRYLFLAGAMLALFTAVACLGWMELPVGAQGRSLWRVVGLVALAGIVVFFPAQQVHRLTALRTDIRNRDRVQSDLRKVAQTTQAKAVLRACGPVFVPNHRPVPLLASGRTSGRSRSPPASPPRGSRRRGGAARNAEVQKLRSSTHTIRARRSARPGRLPSGEPQPLVAVYAGPTLPPGVGKVDRAPLFEIGLRAARRVSDSCRASPWRWAVPLKAASFRT